MANKSLRRVLPAMLLFGCAPVFAQFSNNLELGRELHGQDVPVRQGIASDGTQLHENMETMPVSGAVSAVSHQGRRRHRGADDTRADANFADPVHRNRVMCEHRRNSATAWRCKPHAQQR